VPEPAWIKCSQLHGPRTVLIGDAANCSAPVLGQGANSALEDVSVLVATLRRLAARARGAAEARADFVHGVNEYTRARRADVHALTDLSRRAPAPHACTCGISVPRMHVERAAARIPHACTLDCDAVRLTCMLCRYMVGAMDCGVFAAFAFLPLLVHVTFGRALSLLPWVGKPAVEKIPDGMPYSAVLWSIVRDFVLFALTLAAVLAAILFAR
jgi:hypothetical protein